MENILSVENLTKIFKKNGTGIKDLSFSVPKGKITGFVGDNGAGKTTSIKCILGVFRLDSGKVYYKDHELKHDDLKEIAFFPDQNNYPKNYNIIYYAEYCAQLKGLKKKDYKDLLENLIADLDLQKFRKSKFSDLSAGQQKRALLLSTLLTNPEFIILDEPTANLDVKTRLEFLGLLSELSTKYGTSILITSHNIDELEKIIDYIIIIRAGSLMYENNFNLETEKLRDIYEKYNGSTEESIKIGKTLDSLKKNSKKVAKPKDE